MVTLNATYRNDLGRVRLQLSDMDPNVSYTLQRSTDAEPTWVDVRGGDNLSTVGVSSVDDYEYTPNIVNYYRVTGPPFYDSFNRSEVTWGTADTGQSWNLGTSSPGFGAYVDNGIAAITSSSPSGDIAEFITDPIAGAENAELTWSAIYPDNTLDNLIEFDVGLRATDHNNYYEAQIIFEDDDGGTLGGSRDVFIRIAKFIGGSFTSLTAQIEVGKWEPNIAWHARFRVQGTSLQLRAWQQGRDEPDDWQIATTDTDLTTGNAVHARGRKSGGSAYEQWFGPMELNTIPQDVADTTAITPIQSDTFLKSITYPLLNQAIECVDWEEQVRESRSGFFNIKGRHEILGIADVGSSATFELTFITRSKAENRAMVALLTYGGLMLLQPPGDSDLVDCPVDIAGLPEGFVMVGESVQAKPLKGIPVWQWTVTFTKVAASDAAGILPTTITWELLWELIGPEGTWETVWATWPTWEQLWLERGNPGAFGGGF